MVEASTVLLELEASAIVAVEDISSAFTEPTGPCTWMKRMCVYLVYEDIRSTQVVDWKTAMYGIFGKARSMIADVGRSVFGKSALASKLQERQGGRPDFNYPGVRIR
jgi:hypothetical protein